MKAIQIFRYRPNLCPILHTDVVEVERTVLSHRQFMCRRCGLNWREEINEPATVIEDKEVEGALNDYFPNYELCTESYYYKK